MWTSIYIANKQAQADRMQKALQVEDFLTNVRFVGGAVAQNDGMFEIQVLESEVEEAQSVVYDTSTRL